MSQRFWAKNNLSPKNICEKRHLDELQFEKTVISMTQCLQNEDRTVDLSQVLL